MAGTFNTYDMMKGIAERGLRSQKRNPQDRVGPDGLLICGHCGEPRQEFIKLPDPIPGAPNRVRKLKVAVICRCDREAEEKERKKEEGKKNLERIKALRNSSLMVGIAKTWTFEKDDGQHNAENLRRCRNYAKKFDSMIERNQGLLLYGSEGTGKSFAAACIANYLLDRMVPVIMTSTVKLISQIQSGSYEEEQLIQRMSGVKLLVLDDFGAERRNEYAAERVYNIIDSRYRQQLPMILTTNLNLNDMKAETDMTYRRIYDRIFEVCYPLQFAGPSRRKEQANKKYRETEKLLNDD